MTMIQAGAVLAGLAGVAFFGLFGGYYYRNRRMALQARDAAGGRAHSLSPATVDARDADDVAPSTR